MEEKLDPWNTGQAMIDHISDIQHGRVNPIVIRVQGGVVQEVVSGYAGVLYMLIDLDNLACGEEGIAVEQAQVVPDIAAYIQGCLEEAQ